MTKPTDGLKVVPLFRLGEDRLEVVAKDFRVINSRQELLFAANRKEVVVGADILRVSGKMRDGISQLRRCLATSLFERTTDSKLALKPCNDHESCARATLINNMPDLSYLCTL